MRYFFLLFFLISINDVCSQNGYKKDSITISEYKKKVVQYINPQPDSALYYIKKSFKVSQKSNFQKGLADTEYLYAQYFRRTQQTDSSLHYLRSSAKRSVRENHNIGAAIAYNGLCRNLYLLTQYGEAEEACQKALTNIKSDTELSYMTRADTYTALGTIYSRQDYIEKAQVYFLKVDSMHSRQALRPDVIAAAYQNLGGIYLKFNDLNLAESYYIKANNQFEKLPPQAAEYYISTNNVELGKLFFKEQKLNKADSILTKSLKFFIQIKDLSNAAEIGTTLAKIKLDKNQLDDAELYFKESFNFYEKSDYNLEAAINALELAKLSLQKNDLKTALKWSQTGVGLNRSVKNSPLKMDLAFVMADTYSLINQHEIANKLSKIGYKIKDSLSQVEIAETIKEIEGKYQTEKRDKEITSLKTLNNLALQEKKNQRNLLVGAICITTVAGLLLFFLFRNRQKTNNKLKELDALKSNFFANISHEFRTPLTLITSPIDDTLEDYNISTEKRQQFVVAKQNSDRLLELVNQLLDLSKIDAGHLKLQMEQGNILQLISALGNSFSHHAKKKNITYTLNIDQNKETSWYDKDAVEKITVNLLSNAIKYTPKHGTICFKAYIENNKLFIEIKNTGKGLTKHESEHVFERFYKTKEQNQGTGIGLALVKELVELHKGKIEVVSIPNKETSFKLNLAIDQRSFKSESVKVASTNAINIEKPLYADISSVEEPQFTDSDLPILLLVEDNDDLRNLLKQTFEDSYTIIATPNGVEGVKQALEQIPDLIISDIMMPEKDGIELTQELKTDERTAHIPIILLTAKADVESQFKGIDIGADDYITKPFDKKLLALKVEKLIESRKQLQLRYSQELILMPKDITINNLDEKFLEKVQLILEKNLVECSFSVTDFSEAVGMSRMQLHRKLKALTGLTASEFIRSQRLKLAEKLLKTSNINISQVGYSVGFNDHSYFAKCFKKAYHCTPTEYVKHI